MAAKSNPFHNVSTADLAEEYGNIKATISPLEKRLEVLKEELQARIDDTPAIGPRWTVTKSESVSKRMDVKRLRADLGDALDPYEVESKVVRMLVKPTMILGEIPQAAE